MSSPHPGATARRRFSNERPTGVGADGGSILRANLLRVPSVEALAGSLTSEAYQLAGGTWRRAAQAIPEFVKRLRLRPSVTIDDTGRPQFAFAPTAAARDSEQLIDDVYRILADVAQGGPAILMLDEFQAAVDLSPRLPKLLKALSDEHPMVSLVLAGSRRHLMEALVLAPGAPLYNMAERMNGSRSVPSKTP